MKKSHFTATIVAAMLVVTGTISFADPTTYHVSPNGSDSDGLTWDTAFKTIPGALAKAGDGETVLVTNGVYATLAADTTYANITNAITIRSIEGPELTIISNAFPNSTVTMVKISAAGATLDGFTLTWAARRPVAITAASVMTNCVVRDRPSAGYEGVYLDGGAVVAGCRIINCRSSGTQVGGAVYAYGVCNVVNCVITNNTGGSGALMYTRSAYGGTAGQSIFRNCLIAGNQSSTCAVFAHGGGTFENCTIAGNKGGGMSGYSTGLTLYNCIVAGNQNASGAEFNISYPSGKSTFVNSCVVPLPSAAKATMTDCIGAPPMFVDAAAGDFRLRSSSLCIGAAKMLDWMVGADDLAGNPRVSENDGLPDIGCYEWYVSPAVHFGSLGISGSPENYGIAVPEYGAHVVTNGNAYTCRVSLASTNSAVDTAGICTGGVFSVTHGTNTVTPFAGNVYIYNHSGDDVAEVAWLFFRQFKISCTPTAGGAGDAIDRWVDEGGDTTFTAPDAANGYAFSRWIGDIPDYVDASQRTITVTADQPRALIPLFNTTFHVAPDGDDENDGFSWATAFRTIPRAVTNTVVGDTVLVTNGVYTTLAADKTYVDITAGITLRSMEGPKHTVISNSFGTSYSATLVDISSSGATLDGFTITRAKALSVSITQASIMTNCIVRDRSSWNNAGNVWLSGGAVVTDSHLINNLGYGSYKGGVLYIAGVSTVENCVITNNNAGGTGPLIYLLSPSSTAGQTVIRNCLIADNYSGGCVIFSHAGGTCENCTIAGNMVGGMEIYDIGVTVKNCIFGGNTNASGTARNVVFTGSGKLNAINSCIVAPPADKIVATDCIYEDPRYRNAARGNYALSSSSPCIDTGMLLAWMTYGATDLADAPRVFGKGPDMGCFECHRKLCTIILVR